MCGTAIPTSLMLSAAGVLPIIFVFNLNDSESDMLLFAPSLWYYHTLPVSAKLLLYSIRP